MTAFQRFRQTYGFLLLLAAAGSFLLVPFDLATGDYGMAAGRAVVGVALLFLLPKPKPRRI
jgi:hypothetical protein